MKCPNCGKEIANDSQFCEFCGTKINLIATTPNSGEKSKSKKGWITCLIILLLCCLACLAWLICRELAYQDYINRYDTYYSSNNWKWTSTNKRDNSVSSKEFTLNLDGEDCINIDYEVSSEDNCDKLVISLRYPNGEEEILQEISGRVSSTVYRTVWTDGVYVLKFKYVKDGSVSRYSDRASINKVSVDRNRMWRLRSFSNDFFRIW